jgi:polysaccharide pyruvyl transferase WcaK-like protein
VLCYGFLGMGNVGNEASLTAFLNQLRAVQPQARVWCLGMGAEDVERRHGIPARRLTTSRPGSSRVARLFARLADIPRTWWLIGRADTVVVPGMGVFETSLGGSNPFGLAYWLAVVAVGARLRRRRLLLISVGADRSRPNPATTFLFRHTLRLATYCSFRDEVSARAARKMAGTSLAVPVRPDLAFALPPPECSGPRAPGRIVVGVMRFGPRDDPSVMGQYRAKLVRAISSLVHEGASIRLVIGDVADLPLADEIADAVRSYCEVDEARVAVSHADNQNDLMAEMAGAEVVVASRYHNVIAALRVGVPVVSLGYAGKNAALLERFGLAELDQPIEEFDPDVLLRHIAEARASSRSQLRRVLAQMQESLREQELEIAPLLEST